MDKKLTNEILVALDTLKQTIIDIQNMGEKKEPRKLNIEERLDRLEEEVFSDKNSTENR